MKKILLLSVVLLSTNVFAKSSIRFPILVEGAHGVVGIGEYKKELAQKNISIPDYVIIKSQKDLKKIDAIGAMIDDAGIDFKNKRESIISLSMVYYGTLSDYQGPQIKYPICYMLDKGVDSLVAAKDATKLVLSLTDSVLTDQYTPVAVRYFGQSGFKNDQGEDFDEELNVFKKTKLNKGDVQIINVTNDSGDNLSEDILSVCQ